MDPHETILTITIVVVDSVLVVLSVTIVLASTGTLVLTVTTVDVVITVDVGVVAMIVAVFEAVRVKVLVETISTSFLHTTDVGYNWAAECRYNCLGDCPADRWAWEIPSCRFRWIEDRLR